MNNLDKIIDRITADAKSEADKIIADAIERAAEITEDGENRVKDSVSRTQKNAEREALSQIERAYSAADMKKREIMLATKVGLIGKAFRLAEEKILGLSDKEYCVFAGHLLCDAVSDRVETVKKLREEYGDDEEYSLDFTAVFNENDKKKRAPVIIKAAKALLKEKSEELGKTEITVSDETANISGGLILRYGDIETNCSVEAVIADIREKMEPKVAKILFDNSVKSGNEGVADDT